MILLVDKPGGFTSFDVVKKLKRLYPKTKIGHGGTLDPMATGLLVIGMGKDTKKLGSMTEADKDYICTIDLSRMSDTRDTEYREDYTEFEYSGCGLYKEGEFIKAPSREEIENYFNDKIKDGELPVPPFSAKKKNGKKGYELAREGKDFEMREKMTIYSYEIISYDFPFVKVFLNVGKGTYIRSLAYDLGKNLHTGGILCQLRRTRIGDYKLPEG